jgi:hypothetical protein
VVAGAEGERGLDLDGEVVDPQRCAVMRSVDEEAPGPHRPQPIERRLDPILRRDPLEGGALRGRADDRAYERADRRLVRLRREIGLDQPAAVGALEGGDGGLGRIEDLAEEIGHAPRRGLVGRKPHDVGRPVGVEPFEHAAHVTACRRRGKRCRGPSRLSLGAGGSAAHASDAAAL